MFVRSLALCFAFVVTAALAATAQGPPLNGTPEQLFDAGMNALSGSAGTRNDLAAVDYFRRSAQKGYGPAQVVLGYLYDTGQIVVRDTSQAADWYRKAADAGDPLAPHWFQVAAEQGLPQAQYAYGWTLKEGRGIEQDRVKAYTWFLLAMEGGYPAALSDLGLLEGVLSRDQIDQAKTDARKLDESVGRSVAAHGCTGWDGEFSEIPAPPPPKIQKFCR